MHDLLFAVVQTLLGAGIGWKLARKNEERACPFKWVCREEGCAFKVEANELGLLDRLISAHQRSSHA